MSVLNANIKYTSYKICYKQSVLWSFYFGVSFFLSKFKFSLTTNKRRDQKQPTTTNIKKCVYVTAWPIKCFSIYILIYRLENLRVLNDTRTLSWPSTDTHTHIYIENAGRNHSTDYLDPWRNQIAEKHKLLINKNFHITWKQYLRLLVISNHLKSCKVCIYSIPYT